MTDNVGANPTQLPTELSFPCQPSEESEQTITPHSQMSPALQPMRENRAET